MSAMTSRTYDTLKWTALVFLPALSALVAALGTVWSWEWTVPTVGTLAAVTTFVGALVGVSGQAYQARRAIEEN